MNNQLTLNIQSERNAPPDAYTLLAAGLRFDEKRKQGCSYRECFGFKNPPPGTVLKLAYMSGMNWYLLWESCPDGEDIIEGWMSKKKIIEYANKNKWICK